MTTCARCGANLTEADFAQPACRYCGTVHAHVARAAEKVAIVNALMGDANRNGIPDALEGMAMLGSGMPPSPPGGPLPPGAHVFVSASAVVIGGGAAPPATGGPVGGRIVAFGVYPQGSGPDVAAHVRRRMNRMLLVTIALVGFMILMAAGIVAFVVLGS